MRTYSTAVSNGRNVENPAEGPRSRPRRPAAGLSARASGEYVREDRHVPATIAWVSDGEQAKPRRRRGRRRGRRAADSAENTASQPSADTTAPKPRRGRPPRG